MYFSEWRIKYQREQWTNNEYDMTKRKRIFLTWDSNKFNVFCLPLVSHNGNKRRRRRRKQRVHKTPFTEFPSKFKLKKKETNKRQDNNEMLACKKKYEKNEIKIWTIWNICIFGYQHQHNHPRAHQIEDYSIFFCQDYIHIVLYKQQIYW